jgi:uncharacterized protein YdgA (DUF945 family)
MRKPVLYSLGALLLAAAAFAATTAYLGHSFQNRYQDALQNTPFWSKDLPVETEMASYERGLFGAEAVTFYHFAGKDDPFLEVRHDIRYGPLLFGSSTFGAAAVQSRVMVPQSFRRDHPGLLPSGPCLTARTWIGFHGDTRSRISSPEKTWGNGTLEIAWKGLQGVVEVTGSEGRTVTAQMQSPGFRVESKEAQETMTWEGLTLNLRSRLDPSGEPREQTTEMRADRMLVRDKSSSGTMESIVMQSRSHVSDGLAHGKMELRFASFNACGFTFKEGRLESGLKNVSKRAVQRMAELRKKAFAADRGEPALDPAAAKSILKEVLRSSPVFELSRLQFRTEAGTIRLTGKVAFEGRDGVPLQDNRAMLDRIDAEASLRMPQRFAAKVAAIPATFSAAFDPQRLRDGESRDLQTYARRQAERWLQGLQANGLLKAESGSYTTSAELLDGMVKVNGITLLDLHSRMK